MASVFDRYSSLAKIPVKSIVKNPVNSADQYDRNRKYQAAAGEEGHKRWGYDQ
jgi:hypothetical protein